MKPLRRILLADDDQEVRLGVAELLLDLGLQVLHAETGPEAVELARAERIHAALLDMHMPGCTGIEAVSILRRELGELPFLVYSGRWSPQLERAVLEAGAWACLKKPVQPQILRSEVCRALGLDLPRLWKPENPN